jgi:very-long-chain ceramide synthase
MVVWIYLRHYINLKIIWSLLTEFRTVGPFIVDWENGQYKFWLSQYITTGLLSSLQALNLFWLFHIVRIAYRFMKDTTLEDDRSDDEDDLEEPAPIAPALSPKTNGHAVNGSALNGAKR